MSLPAFPTDLTPALLADRTALVTGGASGIGRAITALFAASGAYVLVADLDAPHPQPGADDARRLQCDVSDENSVRALAVRFAALRPHLDILVNCAGVPQSATPIETMAVGDWDRIMSVNARSLFLTTKHFLPALRSSGNASIVNICSVVGVRPKAALAAYSASKAAAIAITQSLALELAKVALQTRTLHLTEDRAARALAHTLLDIEGAWLQVVLMEARRRCLVSRDRYPRMVAMLAAKRHGHIGLDAQSMADLARDRDPAYRDAFAALVPYIGNPTADIESHLRVVMGAILRLWSFGQADLAAMRATGTLLAALSRHPGLNADRLGEFIAEHADGLPALRQYARDWARGHFLRG